MDSALLAGERQRCLAMGNKDSEKVDRPLRPVFKPRARTAHLCTFPPVFFSVFVGFFGGFFAVFPSKYLCTISSFTLCSFPPVFFLFLSFFVFFWFFCSFFL